MRSASRCFMARECRGVCEGGGDIFLLGWGLGFCRRIGVDVGREVVRVWGMGLDSVELLMAVEEEFSICLSDAEVGGVRTPGELIEVVCAKVGDGWSRDRVREVVRGIVREQLGVEDFSDDAEFVRDLGMG